MPNILASMLIQFLSSSSNRFLRISKNKENYKISIFRYTIYISYIFITLRIVFLTHELPKIILKNNLILSSSLFVKILISFSYLVGTIILLWIAEQINKKKYVVE